MASPPSSLAPGHAAGRGALLLGGLVLLATASLLFSLASGSVALDWSALWQAAQGAAQGPVRQILELRLGRALNAFACGGLLALAGALLQVLLRNPLADPYILGVSGGASVGALGALLLGLGSWWTTGSAFGGALFAMLLVFGLARGRGSWSPTRLLLTGVVVAAGWGALISFLLAISPDTQLRGMLFWLMGDLSLTRFSGTGLVILSLGLLASLPLARDLNVLVRGELRAGALGVPVRTLHAQLYITASLLTASAVTIAGNIGFVGLVIPHLIRLLGGRDHRILLPAAVLLGASLLMVADTLARTVLAPQQLPVGVVTALLGVPLFLYLLQRNSHQ
ncbi:MAG: FecCD family ABC transporter permease [Gammaproteobacteria bacterium]